MPPCISSCRREVKRTETNRRKIYLMFPATNPFEKKVAFPQFFNFPQSKSTVSTKQTMITVSIWHCLCFTV